MKNIFKPYLIFIGIYLLLNMAGGFVGQHKIDSLSQLPAFFAGKLINTLFFTSYWFIFNYFISVMILLSMRKYLYEAWFGVFLFSCTVIYAINVHIEWFIPHHSSAFMGFTFFLWLGANLKKREDFFWNLIDNTPYWKVITVLLITLMISFYETVLLLQKGATVVEGSLRFSNILYCLTMFILLCKIGMKAQFTFLNPRDETYPLYLIHPVFLKIINYGILPFLPAVGSLLTLDQPSEVSWLNVLLFQLGWFIGIYTLSLIAVKVILYSPMRWVFGKQSRTVASAHNSFRVLVNGVKNLKFR